MAIERSPADDTPKLGRTTMTSPSKAALPPWFAWQPWMWGAFLAAITVTAFQLSRAREAELYRVQRVRAANDAFDAWRSNHARALGELDALDGFFHGSRDVEASEFDRFCTHLGRRVDNKSAFAWYRRNERAPFETRWSLVFAWPPASFGALPHVLDSRVAPETEFLERAYSSKSPVASAPSALGISTTPQGFLQPIMLCIGHVRDTHAPASGVVVRWIEGAENGHVRAAEGVSIAYFDEGSSGPPTRLREYGALVSEPVVAANDSLDVLRTRALFEESFVFADRRRTAISFETDSAEPRTGLASYLILCFGALAAVVGVQWQRGIVRREQRIEREVLARTHELRAANEELDGFSYSVSHDLRAPLRALSGFSKVLTEDHGEELSPDARKSVDAIARNAERMGRLIDDLLRLSRASRQPLRLENVPLDLLVDQVWTQLGSERAERTIRFRREALPTVLADRGLLEQVFVNLLSNAIKFTRQRSDAEVSIECSADANDVEVNVRDNGVGFDMRYASQLFGVFQRLHRAEDFEGTGVGLALSRRIAVRHGGTLTARSQPGVGSTFTLHLPRASTKP